MMFLTTLIAEGATLGSLRIRQGYAGEVVGDQPSPWLRVTRLGYAVGHGAAFAALRPAKPQIAPSEHAGITLTPALSQREKESRHAKLAGLVRGAIRRLAGPGLAIPPSRAVAPRRDPVAGLPKLLSGELSVADVEKEVPA